MNENEIYIQAALQETQKQRSEAQDRLAHAVGHIAVLEAKLQAFVNAEAAAALAKKTAADSIVAAAGGVVRTDLA